MLHKFCCLLLYSLGFFNYYFLIIFAVMFYSPIVNERNTWLVHLDLVHNLPMNATTDSDSACLSLEALTAIDEDA